MSAGSPGGGSDPEEEVSQPSSEEALPHLEITLNKHSRKRTKQVRRRRRGDGRPPTEVPGLVALLPVWLLPLTTLCRDLQGRYISDISLEEVMQYVDRPAHTACQNLGLGELSQDRSNAEVK